MVTFVLLGYTTCEVVDIFSSYKNLYSLTQNCCLTFTHFAGVYKIFNVLLRKKELLRIVELLENMSEKYAITSEQKSEIKRTEKLVKRITTMFATLVFITAVLGCLNMALSKFDVEKRTFPFRAYLPKFVPNMLIIPFYWYGVTCSAMLIVTHDCLFMGFMNYICAHLRILELSMIPLTDKMVQNPTEKLINCIEHHQLIVKLSHDVEFFFTSVIMGQFITSLLVIGLTAFQITVAIDISAAQASVVAYMGCVSSELLIYCWFGNQVLEKVVSFFSSIILFSISPKFVCN